MDVVMVKAQRFSLAQICKEFRIPASGVNFDLLSSVRLAPECDLKALEALRRTRLPDLA